MKERSGCVDRIGFGMYLEEIIMRFCRFGFLFAAVVFAALSQSPALAESGTNGTRCAGKQVRGCLPPDTDRSQNRLLARLVVFRVDTSTSDSPKALGVPAAAFKAVMTVDIDTTELPNSGKASTTKGARAKSLRVGMPILPDTSTSGATKYHLRLLRVRGYTHVGEKTRSRKVSLSSENVKLKSSEPEYDKSGAYSAELLITIDGK